MKMTKSLLLAGAALVACAPFTMSAHAQADRTQLAQAAPPASEKEKGEQHRPAPAQQRPGAAPAQPQRPAQAPAAPAQQPASPPHQPPQAAPPPRQPAQVAPPHPVPPRATPAAPAGHPPTEPRAPTAQQPQAPHVTQPTVPAPTPQRPAQSAPPAPQQQPGEAKRPGAPPPQHPAQTTTPAPSPQQKPGGAPAAQSQPPRPQPPIAKLPAASVPPPPQQPKDASQFIRQPGTAPTRTIQDLRKERQQTRQGNVTIIREGDRTMLRQGNRLIIRHPETERFAVGARDVHVERRGRDIVSIIDRPNGDRIITVTDPEGRLIRRVRREPNGREIIIIDESAIPRRDNYFIAVPPPRVVLPPDRYFVELDRAPPERIYDTLIAPPFEQLGQVYTIDQVRYNPQLRMLMPRVDLDINFDTGSWQITPDQIGKLSVIADGLNRAIERNPRELFLIEGHTDAVGSDEDNLSLSDRRAESVAVALTQEFGVPPENLLTQGYGKQELKVPTGGPSRENRRVAVRRITPLVDRMAGR